MKKPKIRRLERYSGRHFQPYAIAIGQSSMAWNDLHEWLGLLFDFILQTTGNAGLAIWHSANADRASREMLKSILHTVGYKWPRGFPKAEEDIEWILTRTNSLEDARNDIIHSPLWAPRPAYPPDGFKPTVAAQVMLGHRRAAKLFDKDLLTEYRWCRDTALALRDFTSAVRDALAAKPGPWPDRPALPNRGQKKSRRDRPRQQPPKRLPRQPQSSRG